MVASGSRFRNLRGVTWTQPVLPLLKWRIGRRFEKRVWFHGEEELPLVRDNDGSALAGPDPTMTWIGHATFAVRLGGALTVIDPIWGHCVDIPRARAPGVPMRLMPRVDVVAVTHNHYDHCHLPSLYALARAHDPLFVVPRGVGRYLRRAGIYRVTELSWWEDVEVADLRVTLVPAQHWSARSPFDVNKSLWGGFVLSSPEGTAYHSGDTAFEPEVFRQIADRMPPVDWAMLPIGAYDPEWFLETQHIGPEDAGRAFEVLGARRFVAMHHGTFRLTDEPMDEPAQRCRAWFQEQDRNDELWMLDIGETRALERL